MSNLPVSPIAPTVTAPTAQPNTVQINLADQTGQIVTGGEFGLSTSMGDINHDYLAYADPSFQALADQHPVDLLRHNWELNTMMDAIYPSRGASPDFTFIDNYLNQQSNLTGFINNNTATQIVTLGFPSWLDVSSASDQQLYAQMVVQVAQHFAAMGEPIMDFELVNEPDGRYSVTDLSNTFNAVAEALHAANANYKLGGLTESWMNASDYQTFFNMCASNIGFVSWHQYPTNGGDGKSDQQVVTDSMGVEQCAQQVRQMMQAAGIPNSVPMFLGEYNVDGGNYNDPNNGNMVGAVAAAAATYGMIAANSNITMGALWETLNDGSYNVFGGTGNYHIDSVGIVLSDLTDYMPGNIVPTTMPSNDSGLVGYTTEYNGGVSVALINTNLSSDYTVDLSKDGLPTTGLKEIIVSPSNPNGQTVSLSQLSAVDVTAGSVVIITNEASHGGVLFTGGSGSSSGGSTSSSGGSSGGSTSGGSSGGSTSGGGSSTGGSSGGTTSGNGAILIKPGSGSFTDSAGNVYTIDSSGDAMENGQLIPGGSGTDAMELYNGTVYGQDSGSGTWYTWNQSAWTQATAAPPAPTTGSSAATPSPVTVGSGSDTLVLNISEDAYANGDGTSDAAGDATFTVSVDGKQLAGTFTAQASHSAKQDQAFTFKGNWAAGAHTVAVNFLNDAYAGTQSTDRNLYVDGITYDGANTGQSAPLYSDGTQTFTVTDTTAIPPAVIGSGTDNLVVEVSEDAYLGNAQFTVAVDGKQLGGTLTATTLHSSGGSQAFDFAGDFGAGQHTVKVSFLNDAYGGSPSLDRNLYVNDIIYNGTDTGDNHSQHTTGSCSFNVTGGTAPSVSETGDHGSLQKNLSQTGNYTVGSDTFVLGSGNTVSATLGSGTSSIAFIGPSSLNLTGGSGNATVTADTGNNTFTAGSGSLNVTGGGGMDTFVFHSNSGMFTIEDFSVANGDKLVIDTSLKSSMVAKSDGEGGTLLTFGSGTTHAIDLHGLAAAPTSATTWS